MKRASRLRLADPSLSNAAALLRGGHTAGEAASVQHRNQHNRRIRRRCEVGQEQQDSAEGAAPDPPDGEFSDGAVVASCYGGASDGGSNDGDSNASDGLAEQESSSPPLDLPEPPPLYVGSPVRKRFGRVYFEGKVIAQLPRKHYRVEYSNGEYEDLDVENLEKILLPPPPQSDDDESDEDDDEADNNVPDRKHNEDDDDDYDDDEEEEDDTEDENGYCGGYLSSDDGAVVLEDSDDGGETDGEGEVEKRTCADAPPEMRAVKRARTSPPPSGPSLFDLHGIDCDHLEEMSSLLEGAGVEIGGGCPANVTNFFLFCHERQRMWERRNFDEDVTTEHDVLRTYKFCNVYRELDRGTQYFQAQMAARGGQGRDVGGVLFASVAYRLVNRVDTFVRTGGIPTPEGLTRFVNTLIKMRKARETIFTDQHQTGDVTKLWKSLLYTRDHLDALAEAITRAGTAKGTFRELLRIPHTGRFFAWQITCDLLESR
eukprot:CAMPEP_0194283070 /NCGR_PEP_ID=MMETSP0169-20130528/24603_1 /TAXON_ID=218684 /ORGANISM="Corethron pennatum, Strain L29A3" /LENGTH=485 /DNA_ID=CAMNT_0039028595 /DNA_START=1 /DNA_END=1455 /DNA_ORIENTATION=+